MFGYTELSLVMVVATSAQATACSGRENQGLGRIRKITDSQVDIVIELRSRFYRIREQYLFPVIGLYLETNF